MLAQVGFADHGGIVGLAEGQDLLVAALDLAADHGGLDHAGMVVQRGLDLGRINVETAADDQLARAARDVQVSIRVEPAQVAGAEEPVRIEGGGGRLGACRRCRGRGDARRGAHARGCCAATQSRRPGPCSTVPLRRW